MLLERIASPADVKSLSTAELTQLASEVLRSPRIRSGIAASAMSHGSASGKLAAASRLTGM